MNLFALKPFIIWVAVTLSIIFGIGHLSDTKITFALLAVWLGISFLIYFYIACIFQERSKILSIKYFSVFSLIVLNIILSGFSLYEANFNLDNILMFFVFYGTSVLIYLFMGSMFADQDFQRDFYNSFEDKKEYEALSYKINVQALKETLWVVFLLMILGIFAF